MPFRCRRQQEKECVQNVENKSDGLPWDSGRYVCYGFIISESVWRLSLIHISMTEMKNICGKIPKDLHEKVREEIELTESSTQKFIQQVIEEHFERLAGKGEMSMGTARTIAVQVLSLIHIFRRCIRKIEKQMPGENESLDQDVYKRQIRCLLQAVPVWLLFRC